jgi:hypothetical protein
MGNLLSKYPFFILNVEMKDYYVMVYRRRSTNVMYVRNYSHSSTLWLLTTGIYLFKIQMFSLNKNLNHLNTEN